MLKWQFCFITLRRKGVLSLKVGVRSMTGLFTRPLCLKVSNPCVLWICPFTAKTKKICERQGQWLAFLVMTHWNVKAKCPSGLTLLSRLWYLQMRSKIMWWKFGNMWFFLIPVLGSDVLHSFTVKTFLHYLLYTKTSDESCQQTWTSCTL